MFPLLRYHCASKWNEVSAAEIPGSVDHPTATATTCAFRPAVQQVWGSFWNNRFHRTGRCSGQPPVPSRAPVPGRALCVCRALVSACGTTLAVNHIQRNSIRDYVHAVDSCERRRVPQPQWCRDDWRQRQTPHAGRLVPHRKRVVPKHGQAAGHGGYGLDIRRIVRIRYCKSTYVLLAPGVFESQADSQTQSNFPIYVGENIVDANDDVTVVTLNYRTNIFGQPNAPQFNVPGQAQNFGLLDIAAAIEWVHANIAGFGGDPERITLFGQSAGSVAIDAYVYAQAAAGSAGIIKGIIMESGT